MMHASLFSGSPCEGTLAHMTRSLPVKLVHLYTGHDGQSHFEDIELELTPERGLGGVLELVAPVQGMALREVPDGWTADYHNAPRRQLVVNLTGAGEIICGDGTSRVFGPGESFLADDVT